MMSLDVEEFLIVLKRPERSTFLLSRQELQWKQNSPDESTDSRAKETIFLYIEGLTSSLSSEWAEYSSSAS